MPVDKRVLAAEAFWQDEHGLEQQMEAVVAIARKLKFRPKSVQQEPLERRAKQLAHLADVSETIATRALIAYHLTSERPMMGAFLDALGITHENGLITSEEVPAPAPDKVAAAAASLTGKFPPDAVALYLNTLLTQDPDTWSALDGLPQLTA